MALPFVCALLAFATPGTAAFIYSDDQPGQPGGSYGYSHDEHGHYGGGYGYGASRQCWSGGYNVDSDTDFTFPSTGVTRYYDWTITNGTAAPDGFERPVFLVNGQYPGPTLFADWGDTVSVTVHNQLQDNGTTAHWHGVRQFQQNPYDGVPGVSECPLAPGESTTYTFHVTQHGTSWWHTHLSTQWGDGIWGPIVFYGPSALNWDVDLGAMPINDWHHQTVWSLLPAEDHDLGPPPAASNALINGSMTSTYGGKYSVTTVSSGKRFLLRLINSGFDNSFMVSLDNHQMTVIQIGITSCCSKREAARLTSHIPFICTVIRSMYWAQEPANSQARVP
ncbi:hypothetical protein EJ03DRAFT_383088 [Teratosphaeria nubilosa]|uniref:Plastocyanin-like domain-containing protein n=1 Tax=Teratosphaeria nubilosa TaxID=161662 RepID=A0A6G1L7G9_9PEZI|nr:hypothetical protein EJ03DRAFT_383088 [Teratosphaeria nubilosa]